MKRTKYMKILFAEVMSEPHLTDDTLFFDSAALRSRGAGRHVGESAAEPKSRSGSRKNKIEGERPWSNLENIITA